MNGFKRLWFLLAMIGLCAGCATPLVAEIVPLLKLSPASLGRELAMQQQLLVEAAGQSLTLDVGLEVDATSVRVAVLQYGRTLARLEWDGQLLASKLGQGWPEGLLAEYVLNDLQLVWWPTSVIRSALPAGWALDDKVNSRTLLKDGRVVVSILLPKTGYIVIHHPLAGYTLKVRSEAQNPYFNSQTDIP